MAGSSEYGRGFNGCSWTRLERRIAWTSPASPATPGKWRPSGAKQPRSQPESSLTVRGRVHADRRARPPLRVSLIGGPSIGTLAVTVARACGCKVAYLPGLSMRPLADCHLGTGKTDARGAYVIADARRTMPHLLHSIDPDESVRAELTMVLGYDDDLAQDATRTSNRLRGLLTSIHPALERVLGPRLRHPAVLALLQIFGSLAALAQASTGELIQVMTDAAPRMRTPRELAGQIHAALAEQTVQIPGTASASEIISGLAESLAVLLKRREILESRMTALLEAHPLAKVLTSMPGGRSQDRCPHPGRDRRRQCVPHHRPPGLLRGTDAHYPSFGNLHPGRRAAPRRQQDAQTGLVPGLVRLAEQPAIAGLPRQEAVGKQAPRRSPHLPHPPPCRRPARHAQAPHPLPTRARTNSLTKPTELDRTDRSTRHARRPGHSHPHREGHLPITECSGSETPPAMRHPHGTSIECAGHSHSSIAATRLVAHPGHPDAPQNGIGGTGCTP